MQRSSVIGLLVLALMVLGFLGYRRHLTRFVSAYELRERSLDEVAAQGRRAGLEVVQIGQTRGLIRRPSSGHRWLLYWGGNTTTYFESAVDVVAALALPPEVGVLIVAPSGYDSPGHPSPASVAREAVQARDWLRSHEGAQTLVLGSFSMGCYSVYAAADPQLAGAVMVGASDDLDLHDPSLFIRYLTPDAYRRAEIAPKVRSLVIQGSLDEPQYAAVVVAWLGGKQLTLEGVDHMQSRLHPTALREQRAFILDALQWSAAAPSP